MSDHSVKVIRINEIQKHPNADSLGLVYVGAFSVCVRLSDWKEGDLAAYIEPDSIVNSSRPEFEFLKGHERIKVKRLRGVYSMGLLVPAPEGSSVGDDVAEILEVGHYVPPMKYFSGGGQTNAASPPFGPYMKYSVENLRKFPGAFVSGEEVLVTEKVHGANARYVFIAGDKYSEGKKETFDENLNSVQENLDYGVMHVGSHNMWRKQDSSDLWWKVLDFCPDLKVWCESHPGWCVYAEIYGVQDLTYGLPSGSFGIVGFDLMKPDGSFATFEEAALDVPIDWVPIIYRGAFDLDVILGLAEGNSFMRGGLTQIREGVVVSSEQERFDPIVGRAKLKVVANQYLERE